MDMKSLMNSKSIANQRNFTDNKNNAEKFREITNSMAKLYEIKNNDYGNSFTDLYKEFGLTSTIIRLSDKLNRLKSLNKNTQLVKDESIKDTLLDLSNYAIMTIIELDKDK